MRGLNKRQKQLYTWLLNSSKIDNFYKSKEFICRALSHIYPRFLEDSSEHNSAAFALLRNDVRAINRSDEVEKIIISSKKGYKIATKEEAEKYIEKRFKRDLKSLKLDWHLKKKCGLDGQLDIELNEIKAFVGGIE